MKSYGRAIVKLAEEVTIIYFYLYRKVISQPLRRKEIIQRN